MKTAITVACLAFFACCTELSCGADGIQPKPVNGTYPKVGMMAVASGSGLIVGPRHVLTNRHVVLDDRGVVEGGFSVLLPQDYKKAIKGRAIYVCPKYDLALIELSEAVPSPRIRVLEILPPLGQKVTSYGFPTGSQFGVALTLTGGQISRHPVEVQNEDEGDVSRIKASLWHDAVITGGSSGGPLVSERGVLVGVNRAVLVENKNHVLAVPCTIVLDFLEKTKLDLTISRVASPDELAGASDVRNGVVFVRVLSSRAGGRNGADRANTVADSNETLKGIVGNSIRTQLTAVPRRQLTRMRSSTLTAAFIPVKPVDISQGQVVRIVANMTIIQVLTDSILVKLDDVLCRIRTTGSNNAEFAAKIGDRIVRNIPMDSVFLVGKTLSYRTVGGSKGHSIMLYPVSSLLSTNEFKGLVDNEIKIRSVRTSRATASDPKAFERYQSKLRHTFVDDSGKFSVEAAVVEVNEKNVRMLTIDEGKELTVPLSRLSETDRRWLRENDTWVKTYGSKYEQLLGEQVDK